MQASSKKESLGAIIARRSLSLSRTYAVVGVFLAGISVLVSTLPQILTGTGLNFSGAGTTPTSVGFQASTFYLISVPLQVFATLAFSTPVLLLYVYDKNNGVLEYFLSLGMDQGDIYMSYLQASVILSSGLLVFEVIVNLIVGAIFHRLPTSLESSALVVAIALPAVAFVTLIMMAFSSLQKQRVGSNQPLGIAIGIFMVMPAYIAPLVVPSLAIFVDLFLAAVIAVLSVLMYFLSSRLIAREKLLP